ncbi:MAG TPA: hypothetical protein VEI97_03185, partial [bacterium]|nr:hypothetical protein [bacterium]
KYGDIALWPYELNADQWGYLEELLQPRYATPATADAHPVQFLSDMVACHWAAAFSDAAGGAINDGDALTADWGPQFRNLAELDRGATSITYETNESPTGLPACAFGSGGLWQENTAGNIAGQVTGGIPFSWWFVAKPSSLSGSAQSFGSLTNNGAANAYLTARVNAAGQYQLASRDDSNNDHSAAGGAADTSIHLHLITFDGGQTVRWYVDGTLTVTMTVAASVVWTFSRFVMGGLYRGSLSEGFTGLRLFEVGLTADEVSSGERTSLTNYSEDRYGTPALVTDGPARGIYRVRAPIAYHVITF